MELILVKWRSTICNKRFQQKLLGKKLMNPITKKVLHSHYLFKKN